ncbi:MAG TPA: ATP-binding cassette domain-containing protein, partial [Steroidobacteraceae bacterium]|nr:ATP-binding cassette domain-containing protein [Steroidobacteraceae bacterium]
MSRADPRYLEVRLVRANLRRGRHHVLRAVSWVVRPGERWVLAGENGAGKTQLLKLLAGTVWPAPAARAVRCYRRGRHTWVAPEAVRDEIAYLGAERQDQYQRYGWNTSVERIVGTGVHHSDIPLDALTRSDRARVRRALGALAIAHLARRPFLRLSYG